MPSQPGRGPHPLRAGPLSALGPALNDQVKPASTPPLGAAAPVIAKYTAVLAAAGMEIFSATTTFAIMRSLRLDRGPSGPVHP